MKWAMLVVVAALSGCAGMNAQNMSADQLKALAADNKNIALCGSGQNMSGNWSFVYVAIDEVRNQKGSVAISAGKCDMVVTTDGTPAPTPPKVTP